MSASSKELEAEAIARLMKFYAVETLEQLVAIQAHHIERLQARLPPARDEHSRTPREG